MKQRKEMGYVDLLMSLEVDKPDYDEVHYKRAVDRACKAGALQVDRLFKRSKVAENRVCRRYTMWRWEWEDEAEDDATEPMELEVAG